MKNVRKNSAGGKGLKIMMTYEIITDTSANLPEELINKFGIKIVSLSFFVNSVEYQSYEEGKKTDLVQFYEMMRKKEHITTSLVSPEKFEAIFESCAKEGKDILYIGISSGISGTMRSANIAADIVKEKYPDTKILIWDSLGAALGQGLLVYKAGEMRLQGSSIDETYNMLEETKLKLCHWFTVDDLFFLSRGGRVSSTTAVFGSLLNIKPVMHVDDNGKLIPTGKVRGRKQALLYLVERFKELAIDPENQVISISHGDCLTDAEFVINEIKKTYNIKDVIYNCLDPVIGAHAGPGTVALFFVGKHR